MHSPNESRRQEGGINASVNMTELRDLVELIATHGFTDFELEREGFRVRLRREQSAASSAGQSATQPIPPLSNQSPDAPSPALVQPVPPISQPPPASSTPASTVAETAAISDADLHTITSPIVGTFYRSPSPTAEQFVRVGSTVEADTVVCIVEAMKLMNEILAETSGTIEKIYVENGQPVEYGQPLFGVRK
jgi:acetyl-CoA carboxylase biotin carboxyl carrier protein